MRCGRGINCGMKSKESHESRSAWEEIMRLILWRSAAGPGGRLRLQQRLCPAGRARVLYRPARPHCPTYILFDLRFRQTKGFLSFPEKKVQFRRRDYFSRIIISCTVQP